MKQYRFVIFTLVFLLVGTLLLGAAGCKKEVEEPPVTPPVELDRCLSITDPYDHNSCYVERAEVESITDYTFCDAIEIPELLDACYENVFGRIANSVNCESIEERNPRDSCLMSVGSKNAEVLSCDKIINLNKRDRCYVGILSNFNYPDNIKKEICGKVYYEENLGICKDILNS